MLGNDAVLGTDEDLTGRGFHGHALADILGGNRVVALLKLHQRLGADGALNAEAKLESCLRAASSGSRSRPRK